MAEIMDITDAAFDAAVENGVTLVDFWATYCGPCKMLGALIEKQVAPQLPDDVKIVKVNVEDAKELAARLEIQSVPVLLVYRDGMLMTRMDGLQKPLDIIDAVNTVIG